MRIITLLLVLAGRISFAYTDGTVLVLSTGAQSLTIINSGSQGGTYTVALSVGVAQKGKVWFSTAGFPERGSEIPCASPCSQSINLEYGQVKYWYEVTDSSGNPLSPRRLSSKLYLPFVRQSCETSPFTVPAMIHGFENYEHCMTFNVASGTDVSNLRVWMWVTNWRDGAFSVIVNGTEHNLATIPITGLICNGSSCTGTTPVPHGMTAGKQAQLNGFFDTTTPEPDGQLNTMATIVAVPGPTTFTFASSIAAGNYQVDGTGVHTGSNTGWTVSQSAFYADETKYFLGMDGPHYAFQMAVPLGASEITAGANNTISFKFKGSPQGSATGVSVHGGWLLDWNVIQPDVEMDGIAVASLNAVPHTTTSHGYTSGNTVLIRDAPGPRWRFNGKRVLTAVGDASHFTFLWGSDLSGETPGVSPYTMANGTYAVPVPQNRTLQDSTTFIATKMQPAPHMYAARCLVPYSAYQYYDPAAFASSPIVAGGNAANGATKFTTATLKDRNDYFPSHASLAKCSDCHTNNATVTYKAGWDLKYFGWHPYVTLVAAIGRGLSEQDGKDIAAYINSIPITTPPKGRPWNPIFQPAVGMDSNPITQWLAGGGLEWVDVYDADSKEWMAPGGSYASWAPGTGTFNAHELPVYIQTPTWMTALPTIHPKDFYSSVLGIDFTTQPMWTTYQGYLANSVSNTFSSISSQNNFNDLITQKYAVDVGLAIRNLPAGGNGSGDYYYPAQYASMLYGSDTNWVTSRYLEIFHAFQLENFLDQTYTALYGSPNPRAGAMYTRGLFGQWCFNWAFHKSLGVDSWGIWNIGAYNTHPFTKSNYFYQTASIYHLQLILDAGDRFALGNFEADHPYGYAFAGNIANQRPSFWLLQAWTGSGLQNTWGWNAFASMSAGPTTPLFLRFPIGFRFIDLFASETDKAEIANQAAVQLLATTTAFSVATWQSFSTANDACPLSHVPVASAGRGGGCLSDGFAFGFPFFSHYSVANGFSTGVAAATITALTSYFNSVYAASGHDFSTDFAATCAYVNSGGVPPPDLFCTNF
jgi:hypothetical protein